MIVLLLLLILVLLTLPIWLVLLGVIVDALSGVSWTPVITVVVMLVFAVAVWLGRKEWRQVGRDIREEWHKAGQDQ